MKMLDVVRVNRDIPEAGVTKGMQGTIVDVYERPHRAYEVEFCDGEGRTIALATLLPEDVTLVSSH